MVEHTKITIEKKDIKSICVSVDRSNSSNDIMTINCEYVTLTLPRSVIEYVLFKK